MKIKLAGRFGFLQIPELVALPLFVAAICLAKFSFASLRIANGEHDRASEIIFIICLWLSNAGKRTR